MGNAESVGPEQPQLSISSTSLWWRSYRRQCIMLVLLFSVVFVATWWLTPIEPCATLELQTEFGAAIYSPDGTMLITSGKQDFGRTQGPLRVWDVRRGQERFSVAADWKAIETVCFSPDGHTRAASCDSREVRGS